MKYKITPAPGYLVAEPIAADEFNQSELASVEDGRQHISTGKVLKVSKYVGQYENFAQPVITEAKEGDTIAYVEYAEHPIKINSQELHIIRFDKIIGFIGEAK